MKAFILLILAGIAIFFAASAFPARDIMAPEQISAPIFNELKTPIFSEERLQESVQESVDDSPEPEIEEITPMLEEIGAPTLEGVGVEKEDPPTPPATQVEQVEEVIEKTPNVASVRDAIPSLPDLQEVEEEKPEVSFGAINTNTREALVNIFCTTKIGGSFKPITGSGIIIDEKGIILTNAHVAQYFLLKDYFIENFIECTIRTESPAQPKYKAKPIFISPSWIKENANGIIQQTPKGTGEDDYALLLITGRTNPQENLPESFPFITPLYNSGNIEVDNEVLLAAYPAGFLGGVSIQKNLYISSTITEVVELFTFESGTLDLFSIGGSVVAQQGSSGGAVVGSENKLLGIIVTSSAEENTQDRDLRAITIAHINRSFMKDTGFDLQTLFSGDITAEAQAFGENIAPELTQLLVDELEK